MRHDIYLHESGMARLEEVAIRLRHDSNARAVFLFDADGLSLVATGEIEHYDYTSSGSVDGRHRRAER